MEEYFEGLDSKGKKAFIEQDSENVNDKDIKLPKVLSYQYCSVLIYACMQEARHEYRSALIVRQLLKLPFEKLNKDHVKLIENMITFSEV